MGGRVAVLAEMGVPGVWVLGVLGLPQVQALEVMGPGRGSGRGGSSNRRGRGEMRLLYSEGALVGEHGTGKGWRRRRGMAGLEGFEVLVESSGGRVMRSESLHGMSRGTAEDRAGGSVVT